MARFRIKYDVKSKKYVVTEFVKEHNHLFPAQIHVPFLRLHRKILDVDATKVRTM